MFCKKCGNVIPENARFCVRCGAALNTVEEQAPSVPAATELTPVKPQPPTTVGKPVAFEPQKTDASAVPFVSEQQKQDANSVLVWGIIGLAFSCTFFLSFLGIIFSAVARSKVKVYTARYGVLYGKAKVGNILSRIGLPMGIVLTIFCIIYIIVGISLAFTLLHR